MVLVFSPEGQGAHRPQTIMALQHATLAARRPPQCPYCGSCCSIATGPMGKARPPVNKLLPSPEKLSHSQACHIRDTLLRDVP